MLSRVPTCSALFPPCSLLAAVAASNVGSSNAHLEQAAQRALQSARYGSCGSRIAHAQHSAGPGSSGGGQESRPSGAACEPEPAPLQQQHGQRPSPSTGPAGSSVSASEAAKFAALAGEWWDPSGPFAPLHAMNPVRCAFLRAALCAALARDPSLPRPLSGLHLLDVGCGGGLLSESLARMGAEVTGVDVNEGGLANARAHAAADPALAARLHYRAATAEQLAEAGESFDAVIASEVIEHVADVPAFCSALAALARPGGGVAVSTLNRTPRSYLAAVLAAERLLRWVPAGTHDWRRFVTPQELAMQAEESSGRHPLRLRLLAGMEYEPLSGRWSLGRDTGINYIAWFDKPAQGGAGE